MHAQPNRVEETEVLRRKDRVINELRDTLESETSRFQKIISGLESRVDELVRKSLLLEDKSAKQQRDISQYRDHEVPGLQLEIAKLELALSEVREQRSNSSNPPVSRFAHELYKEECNRLQAANAVLCY